MVGLTHTKTIVKFILHSILSYLEARYLDIGRLGAEKFLFIVEKIDMDKQKQTFCFFSQLFSPGRGICRYFRFETECGERDIMSLSVSEERLSCLKCQIRIQFHTKKDILARLQNDTDLVKFCDYHFRSS